MGRASAGIGERSLPGGAFARLNRAISVLEGAVHFIGAIATVLEPRGDDRVPAGRSATARRGATAVLASLVLAATLPGHAWAQVIAGTGPLNIAGDHSELVQNGKEMIFRGRVEVIRGENRLRCDTLQVFFQPKGASRGRTAGSGALDSGNIDHVVAEGDVYIVTPNEVVRGDTAVYTAADDTIVTTGKEVILKRGENVEVGTRLVVQRSKGVATLEGGPGGRPRLIFFQKDASAAGANP